MVSFERRHHGRDGAILEPDQTVNHDIQILNESKKHLKMEYQLNKCEQIDIYVEKYRNAKITFANKRRNCLMYTDLSTGSP